MVEKFCDTCSEKIRDIWDNTVDYESFCWQVMDFIGGIKDD